MKRHPLVFGLAALLSFGASPSFAGTVNIVVNGDFETQTFAGWTTDCTGLSYNNTGSSGAADLRIDNPTRWAMLNTQGSPAASCVFYQAVTIPANASAATLQMRYALTGSNRGGAGDRRTIDITDSTGTTTLVTIQPVVSRSTTRNWAALAAPVDLMAYAGQTVRIRALLTHTPSDNSANLVGLDDVVLNVTVPDPIPTLSDWAAILLGITLAGGAALYIQSRRVKPVSTRGG